jgi:lactoylglutathione lyase
VIPIRKLFETHLTVSNLRRAMKFYGGVLQFELAHHIVERGVAFYWIGGHRKSMLGLWEAGGPQRMTLHTAFSATLEDILAAPQQLREAGVEPLDFDGRPTDEPDVLAWMPAASLYFRDPDGNMLEFISMLDNPPAPELGILSWSKWTERLSTVK